MRRLQAIASLVLLAAAGIALVVDAVVSFPRGLVIGAALVAAAVAAWSGIRRRGTARNGLLALGAALLVAAVVIGFVSGLVLDALLPVVCVVAAWPWPLESSRSGPSSPPRRGLSTPSSSGIRGPGAARHSRPVLPTRRVRAGSSRSSSPRATTSSNWRGTPSHAARTRSPPQAATGRRRSIATIAAEHDLPFACIPAGTRNHFATRSRRRSQGCGRCA